MNKIYFISVKNGRKYIPNKNNYLRKCPTCKNELHSNRYKDLYVNRITNYSSDISIDMHMEYCENCDNLFIRSDY